MLTIPQEHEQHLSFVIERGTPAEMNAERKRIDSALLLAELSQSEHARLIARLDQAIEGVEPLEDR